MSRTLFFVSVLVLLELLGAAAFGALRWQFLPLLSASARRLWLPVSLGGLQLFLAVCLMRLHVFGAKPLSLALVVIFYIDLVALAMLALYALLHALRLPETSIMTTIRLLGPAIFVALMSLGVWSAYSPKIVRYRIQTSKHLDKPLRILMVSDLHLGAFIGNGQIDKLVAISQREKPDVVVMPGDIMDDVPDVFLANNMAAHLKSLHAPLGVYATLGNHDNYRHVQPKIVEALTQAGVTVLRDETINIHNRFWLIGRRDDYEERVSVKELMPHTEANLPVLVLDHEPTDIDVNTQSAIDLQLTGHTHGGQIFPATWLIHAFQKYVYGQYTVNGRPVVISSGFGLWGLPLRIGTRAEVVMVDMESMTK